MSQRRNYWSKVLAFAFSVLETLDARSEMNALLTVLPVDVCQIAGLQWPTNAHDRASLPFLQSPHDTLHMSDEVSLSSVHQHLGQEPFSAM